MVRIALYDRQFIGCFEEKSSLLVVELALLYKFKDGYAEILNFVFKKHISRVSG